MEQLAKILGLSWTRDEIFKPPQRPTLDSEEYLIPLSLLINPDLVKNLRNWVNKQKDEQGKPLTELGMLPIDEFFKYYQDVIVPNRKQEKVETNGKS